MPKVLRIINRFNLGGPTFNAALLTKHMAPNYETLLIGGQKQDSEESSNFILENLGLKPNLIAEMEREVGLKSDFLAYQRIRKIIQEFKPDIIHTHASKAGAIGRLAGISYGKAKLVHTFHGHVFHSYFGKFKSNVFVNIERFLAYRTNKIVAISPIQKEELFQTYRICPSNKIDVIPLGFDLSKFQENKEQKRMQFRKQYQIEEDEIAIGIVGRLVPIKNHKLFLDSIQYVEKNSEKRIRAFIVGDGSESNDLKRYSKELGLAFSDGDSKPGQKATVHFTSWIKEVDQVNAGMDIIALSSLNEGTPVSLIEAQASEKPIVTTNVGGVLNIVDPSNTALLVENNNAVAFGIQLLKLVEDDVLRKKMGENGWDFVREKFHYSRLVNDMDKLYQSLL